MRENNITKKLKLFDMPWELIILILLRLEIEDILQFGLTSRHAYNYSLNESIWHDKAKLFIHDEDDIPALTKRDIILAKRNLLKKKMQIMNPSQQRFFNFFNAKKNDSDEKHFTIAYDDPYKLFSFYPAIVDLNFFHNFSIKLYEQKKLDINILNGRVTGTDVRQFIDEVFPLIERFRAYQCFTMLILFLILFINANGNFHCRKYLGKYLMEIKTTLNDKKDYYLLEILNYHLLVYSNIMEFVSIAIEEASEATLQKAIQEDLQKWAKYFEFFIDQDKIASKIANFLPTTTIDTSFKEIEANEEIESIRSVIEDYKNEARKMATLLLDKLSAPTTHAGIEEMLAISQKLSKSLENISPFVDCHNLKEDNLEDIKVGPGV